MSGIVKTRHLVLGLLAQQPMSGYDIKRFFKSMSWLIGSPSFGSLYPALHRLLDEGLVSMEVIPQDDRPPRKLYSLTDHGRAYLTQWVSQPVGADLSLKSFVMRLALAGSLSSDGLRDYLARRREQVVGDRRMLVDTAHGLVDGTDIGEQLTLDYALALADAELAWLKRVLDAVEPGESELAAVAAVT